MPFSLMQYASFAIIMLPLALFLLCGKLKFKVQKDEEKLLGIAEPAAELAAPPPLHPPLDPPPARSNNRISYEELVVFMREVPAVYDEAIANGRADEVAWMETSGLRHAAVTHYQQGA